MNAVDPYKSPYQNYEPEDTFDNSKITVNFNIDKELFEGQSICIVGSIPELGAWKEFDAVMTKNHPNSWSYSLTCDNQLSFEYKYVVTDQFNQRQWEQGENHQMCLMTVNEKTHFVTDSFNG